MPISSSIDKSTLRRTSEYYFNNEALSKTQKTLVNYHYYLDIVKNWRNGKNSSSDGMKLPINSKTIYADYNAIIFNCLEFKVFRKDLLNSKK